LSKTYEIPLNDLSNRSPVLKLASLQQEEVAATEVDIAVDASIEAAVDVVAGD
jgi:hypothetical protein